jgi:hypothetical protein
MEIEDVKQKCGRLWTGARVPETLGFEQGWLFPSLRLKAI